MRVSPRSRRSVALLAWLAIGVLLVSASVVPADAAGRSATGRFAPGQAACPPAAAGHARCLTVVQQAHDRSARGPVGLGADALRAAYAVPTRASTTTVAVSIWNNAPHLEHDLNVYRTQYGLGACTSANGCLRVVNQRGASAPLPADDAGVALETTLDVSMISAACPACHILVVEGDTNDTPALAETERTAARLGATVISNSYGGLEYGGSANYRSAYEQAGIVTIASSGDAGFANASSPATYPGVLAVGGTVLSKSKAAPRGWTERAWKFGSSGCSGYFAKPSWQRDPGCPNRLTTDISAAAANIALYYTDGDGWLTVYGTSASAPFVAGLYGLAGNAATTHPGDVYRNAAAFHDVTEGTNDGIEHGKACENSYLCVAAPGYDAPTGLGTPNGIAGL